MELKDLTVQNTAEFTDLLEREVAPPLGLKPEPVYVDCETMVAEGDDLTRKGIIQGLQDLGYLEEKDASGVSQLISDPEIALALAAWRADTLNLPATYRFRARDDSTYAAIGYPDLIDPLPVLVIQTGFDEDLVLEEMPVPDSPPSLLSRILLFRLKTLNRYEDNVSLPLTRETLETFLKLRSHFSRSENENDLALLNRLGSGFQMTEVFCPRYRNHLFVARNEMLSEETGGEKRLAECYRLSRKVRPTSKYKFSKRPRKFRGNARPRSTVLDYVPGKKSGSSLEDTFASDVNSLGLELLQLRLWQHGYYRGALDADWGNMSQNALEDFLQTFQKEFELKRGDFIAKVEGGLVLNLAYLLEDLMQIADDTAGEIKKEDIDRISDHLLPSQGEQDNNDETWEKIRNQADAVKSRETASLELKPVETFRHGVPRKNKRRRRLNLNFFGIKAAITGWFRRIWNSAGSAIDWVKRTALQVRDAIKAGLDSISTFFRYALGKVKRVFRVAKTAVQRFYYWIAGKPFGTGDPATRNFFLTRWSMDYDTVNITTSDCPSLLMENHLKRIQFMNSSMRFMVSLALKVLEIVAKFVTGNWLRLAWAIYTGIRQWKSWIEGNPFINYTQGDYVT